MNRKPYSHILDAVAGDHVPDDLDLAPTIIARIQKGKKFRMQPKTKLVAAILLVAIAFVVLFYSVPEVAAAIQRWFGYVPGIGLVREGQVRLLAGPVSVTREGVTVTVEQAVLNQERTALVYSMDGIPGAAVSAQAEEARCGMEAHPYIVSLRLPDGSPLLSSPDGVDAWGTGYRHRFNYPPVPADVDDATLVISCLFHARPGMAPEDWEIPVHFMPASAEVTTFPVIEIPPSTVPAETVPPATHPVEDAALSLALERAVQMDDGYLLYARLHWEATPFTSVDLIDPLETVHLVDENGQEMLFELHVDEQTGVQGDQRQTVFALKTAPVQSPGPLTLVLEEALVYLPVNDSFVFDPGPNPQPGQQWQPDVELTFGEHRLLVRTITVEQSGDGYSFEMSSDTGILEAGLVDHEHPIRSGYGGMGAEGLFYNGFSYASGLPDGPVTLTVDGIGVRHVQQVQVQWTPPAVSTAPLPAQPDGCLSSEAWQASLANPPALPAGLPARVLTYGPADKNTLSGPWEVAITSLDGSQRQPVAEEPGALSPDGARLAYPVLGGGILIQDLATGSAVPLPGTTEGDAMPFWTPDGTALVFSRGMGIFDLFIVQLDGSGLRQLTFGGVQEMPVAWLPDGGLLYLVPGREDEYTVYRLDLQSGESQVFSDENISSISPDGRYLAITKPIFGDRWQIVIRELSGADRRSLTDNSLSVLNPLWSPDGEWMLVAVLHPGGGPSMHALINLQTCEAIPLPGLQDDVLAWMPE